MLTLPLLVSGQQMPGYTHYMYNLQAINPAFAGLKQVPCFSILHRSQWVGVEGAPVTQSFFGETAITENIGIGGSVMSDAAGPARTTAIALQGSYRIKISNSQIFRLGLTLGGTKSFAKLTELNLYDQGDPIFQADMANDFRFNAGFGALYMEDWYYIGVSVPYLMEPRYESSDALSYGALGRLGRHVYLNFGGAVENLWGTVFKPSAYVKVTGNTWTMDVTLMAEQRNGLKYGGGFRINEGIRFLAGYQFNRKLQLGYSLDLAISNQLPLKHLGSHELMFQYKIFTRLDEFALRPKKI